MDAIAEWQTRISRTYNAFAERNVQAVADIISSTKRQNRYEKSYGRKFVQISSKFSCNRVEDELNQINQNLSGVSYYT